MKKLTTCIFFTTVWLFTGLPFQPCYSQPSLVWGRQMGGTGSEGAYAMTVDRKGNVLVGGMFSDSGDFDPGIGVFKMYSSGGLEDIFITKLNTSGKLAWAKRIGGGDMDMILGIAADEHGNIYLTGAFGFKVDFDPGSGVSNMQSAGDLDMYICKLDSSGNFAWAKQIGGSYAQIGHSIALDEAGNIYATGQFIGNTDFDPGAGTANISPMGYSGTFILKLNAAGNFVWVRSITGPGEYSGFKVLPNNGNNHIILAGNFTNVGDFDPGGNTFNMDAGGSDDGFIWELDTAGNFIRAGQIAGKSNLTLMDIGLDKGGNIYGAGYFLDSCDLDPGTGTGTVKAAGGEDVFVVKLDSSGNYQWGASFGGTGLEHCSGLAVSPDGHTCIHGYYNGTADFDPGTGNFNMSTAGGSNVFTNSLDPSGNFDWAYQMGSSSGSGNVGIRIVNDGRYLYTCGIFNDVIDMDPGAGKEDVTSFGSVDAYVQKLDICSASYSSITARNCFDYTSPSGRHKWTSSGTYKDTIPGFSGCDSVMTISLVIDTLKLGVDIHDWWLSAKEDSATYQWLDCDSMRPIPGETNRNYHSGPPRRYFAVIITKGLCSDTSDCILTEGDGVNDALFNRGISVYPNPGNGKVTVRSEVLMSAELRVMNVSGKLVLSSSLENGIRQLDLSRQAPGVYIIEIISEEGTGRYRLVLY